MSQNNTPDTYHPILSSSGRLPTHSVIAVNQFGKKQEVKVAGERPLTIVLDDYDIVTLMTLGTHPEELVLGYLRNQSLIDRIEDIESVTVDWEKETAAVKTISGLVTKDLEKKLSKRILTSGCGQGTLFSCALDKLYESRLPAVTLHQSTIYALLKALTQYNEIYRQAGAVHGCGLCRDDNVILFVEDVGRHNAADTISGKMWLARIPGHDKVLYTTGRLTSEIVMKSACMGIPVLLSRSGITHMALELAQDLRITMIARAKANSFYVYTGSENIIFDVPLK